MQQIKSGSSKDDPIFIHNEIELDSLKGMKWIQFYCINCNTLITIRWRYDRKDMFKPLLCKACKTKNTNLSKYGVEYTLQNKEIREQIKQTCFEKYGVEHIFQADEVKQKIRETTLEKYGKAFYTQTEEYVRRSKETCFEKYGVDNYTKTAEYKEKEINTNLKKFGTPYASQSDIIKAQVKNTFLEKFGTSNFYLAHKYFYENEYFDSSWELIFYIYNKSLGKDIIRNNIGLKYFYKDKEHIYYPDFLMDNNFYEIKGDMFFDNDKMINPFDRNLDEFFNAKYQCGIDNNVIYIRKKDILPMKEYIDNKYGKDYINSFKC